MIVFFLPDMRIGGAERVMLNLMIKYREEYPDRPVVLLLGIKKGALLEYVPESVPVFTLQSSSGLRSLIPYLNFCRQYKPRVVISTLGSSVTTSVGKLLTKRKTVVINRLGNTIGAEKFLYNKLKRKAYLFANQLIGKFSDHLIFQSDYMEKDFLRETKVKPQRTSTIYNPVRVNNIQQQAKEKVARNFNFVAVGRLSPQKNYSVLIRACAILKNKKIPFSLAILGEGNLRKEIEKEIKSSDLSEHVFLLGQVSNPYPYIRSSHYLVSSSLYEGFSNVIVEALCLGVPVLATDCPGGNAEVIREGFNGFLCKNNSSVALANLMENALQQFNMFNREKIACWSKERFDEDVIFKKYNTLFQHYL